jgi:hypothetical protein
MNDLFKTFENWLRNLMTEIGQQQIAALTERVAQLEEANRIAKLNGVDPVVISQLVSEALDDIDWSAKIDIRDEVRDAIGDIDLASELDSQIDSAAERAAERQFEDADWDSIVMDNFDWGNYNFEDSVRTQVREELNATKFVVRVEN